MKKANGKIRIGCGSGSWADRLDPALAVATRGDVQYMCFDTMSEAGAGWIHYSKRMDDPDAGYDIHLKERLDLILEACMERKITLIGNFGSMNPKSASRVVADLIRSKNVGTVRVGVVSGDDVLPYVEKHADTLTVQGKDTLLSEIPGRIVGANAYMGADPVVEALEQDVDLVVAGRISDASLYLSPMRYEFGWDPNDHNMISRGITIGKMLECGSLACGAFWAEPGYREVPGMVDMALPIAEVYPSGEAIITKAPETGGMVNRDIVALQMIHEVNDPAKYLSPDATADLTTVQLDDSGTDAVRIHWPDDATVGTGRPPTAKALVAIDEGFIAECWFLFSGFRALEKGRMLDGIIRERLTKQDGVDLSYAKTDYIGMNSGLGSAAPASEHEPAEVMVRFAARVKDEESANKIVRVSQFLPFITPMGLGERRGMVRKALGIHSTLLPWDTLKPTVEIMEVS